MHDGGQVEMDRLIRQQQWHPQRRGNDLLTGCVNYGRGGARWVLEGVGQALLGWVGGGREGCVGRGWHPDVVDGYWHEELVGGNLWEVGQRCVC